MSSSTQIPTAIESSSAHAVVMLGALHTADSHANTVDSQTGTSSRPKDPPRISEPNNAPDPSVRRSQTRATSTKELLSSADSERHVHHNVEDLGSRSPSSSCIEEVATMGTAHFAPLINQDPIPVASPSHSRQQLKPVNFQFCGSSSKCPSSNVGPSQSHQEPDTGIRTEVSHQNSRKSVANSCWRTETATGQSSREKLPTPPAPPAQSKADPVGYNQIFTGTSSAEVSLVQAPRPCRVNTTGNCNISAQYKALVLVLPEMSLPYHSIRINWDQDQRLMIAFHPNTSQKLKKALEAQIREESDEPSKLSRFVSSWCKGSRKLNGRPCCIRHTEAIKLTTNSYSEAEDSSRLPMYSPFVTESNWTTVTFPEALILRGDLYVERFDILDSGTGKGQWVLRGSETLERDDRYSLRGAAAEKLLEHMVFDIPDIPSTASLWKYVWKGIPPVNRRFPENDEHLDYLKEHIRRQRWFWVSRYDGNGMRKPDLEQTEHMMDAVQWYCAANTWPLKNHQIILERGHVLLETEYELLRACDGVGVTDDSRQKYNTYFSQPSFKGQLGHVLKLAHQAVKAEERRLGKSRDLDPCIRFLDIFAGDESVLHVRQVIYEQAWLQHKRMSFGIAIKGIMGRYPRVIRGDCSQKAKKKADEGPRMINYHLRQPLDDDEVEDLSAIVPKHATSIITTLRPSPKARLDAMRKRLHNNRDEDYHHDTSDNEEDPRPKKRRKCLDRPCLTPPTATELEIGDAQSQADHGCPLAFIDNKHYHSSRTSRSPSASTESVPVAEYQEWPLQGFLKRTKIGDDIMYNLEFKLPRISEHLKLPINPEALDVCSSTEAPKSPIRHDTAAYSKIRQTPSRPQKKRVRWTPEEDATVLEMRENGCSWEDIQAALPHRSLGTIQVHFSTKLKG